MRGGMLIDMYIKHEYISLEIRNLYKLLVATKVYGGANNDPEFLKSTGTIRLFLSF
jgi:hypothetical protein